MRPERRSEVLPARHWLRMIIRITTTDPTITIMGVTIMVGIIITVIIIIMDIGIMAVTIIITDTDTIMDAVIVRSRGIMGITEMQMNIGGIIVKE